MTILGWMTDIGNRVGNGVAWPITSYHRMAIDFLEDMDEDTSFEDYRSMAIRLMNGHAMARNDIYDGVTYLVTVDKMGLSIDDAEMVSREEKDVRSMLGIWQQGVHLG